MKYIIYLILAAIIIIGTVGAFHLYRVSVKNKKEMSKYEGQKIEVTKNFGKTLIVYYSNSGNTKDIAERIKAKTNADIYQIKLDEELPKGLKLHMAIRKQIKNGNYPKIKQDIPNLIEYDIVFVGAPVWWYTVATPALSFLKQVDFANKKVVPFSTQGSNIGTYFEDFAKTIKNAELLQSAQFNNLPKKYDAEVDNKISVWLNELDI